MSSQTTYDTETRLLIIGAVLALMFGLAEFFEGARPQDFSIDFILQVISSSFINVPIIIFGLYLLCLLICSGFKSSGKTIQIRNRKAIPILEGFFYDLGITATIFLVYIAVTIVLAAKLFILWPNEIVAKVVGWIILTVGLLLLLYLMEEYLHFFKFLKLMGPSFLKNMVHCACKNSESDIERIILKNLGI